MTDQSTADTTRTVAIVELLEPELLVLRAPAMPELGIPDETTTRIELRDEGGRTHMTLTSGPHTPDMSGPAEAGWKSQLEKLVRLLESRST
jgi:Activator of Hsp90 ATPase homolog 1-like protein